MYFRDFPYLSVHPNFTIEWLREFPDKDWNFSQYGLSLHPNVTIEWIREFPDFFKITSSNTSYNRIKAQFLFMNEDPENRTCLNKDIMEKVWSPKNILRYDGKYAELSFG